MQVMDTSASEKNSILAQANKQEYLLSRRNLYGVLFLTTST